MEIHKDRVDIKNLELGTKRAQNMSLKNREMGTGHQHEHMTPERGHWVARAERMAPPICYRRMLLSFILNQRPLIGIQFHPSVSQTCPLVEIGHIPKPLNACENMCCLHPRKATHLDTILANPSF